MSEGGLTIEDEKSVIVVDDVDELDIILESSPLVVDDAIVIEETPTATSGYIAGETVNAFTPVAYINDRIFKYDASNLTHQFAYFGFSTTSATSGGTINVTTEGELTSASFSLVAGQHYLAGNAGTLATTVSAPTNAFKKVIAHAVTTNKILIINDSIPTILA